jgi:ech hydrogenase subunit D
MSEPTPPNFEPLTRGALVQQARLMKQQGYRLVQIGVTRLPEQLELTYSFDLEGRLRNFHVQLPAAEPCLPSISGVYWCAFLYENEMHDLFGVQVDGIAVDFHGHLYQTAVKFPFGSTKAPAAKPARVESRPAAPVQSPSGKGQTAATNHQASPLTS